MRLADMYGQPGYLIRRAHQMASAAFAAAMGELGLTAVQLSALLAIREHPDIDATRVSDLIAFDRTTIGHVLGRLEEKKLITRASSRDDKRIKRIRVTLRGEAVIREASLQTPSVSDAILEPLTSRERETLLALLEKLNATTARADGAKAAGGSRRSV